MFKRLLFIGAFLSIAPAMALDSNITVSKAADSKNLFPLQVPDQNGNVATYRWATWAPEVTDENLKLVIFSTTFIEEGVFSKNRRYTISTQAQVKDPYHVKVDTRTSKVISELVAAGAAEFYMSTDMRSADAFICVESNCSIDFGSKAPTFGTEGNPGMSINIKSSGRIVYAVITTGTMNADGTLVSNIKTRTVKLIPVDLQ